MALQEEFETQGNFLFKYRGILPIPILLFGVLAFVNHIFIHPDINETFSKSYNFICLAITLGGLLIRIYTVGYSAANTSGRNTSDQLADSINVKGIYSIVRHPLYLGNFFMWLGLAMLSEDLWFITAFIFMYWVYYERIMFAEEQYLRNKFGQIYLEWAKKTPAFIPSFSNFTKPATKFNLQKVIRQEKTGLMLVFVIYFLFDQLDLDISHNQFTLNLDIWFYGLVAGVLIYVVIKLFQKAGYLSDNLK